MKSLKKQNKGPLEEHSVVHNGPESPVDEHEELVKKGIIDRKLYCGPERVQIDITNFCNNSCIGCWFYSPHLSRKTTMGLPLKDVLPFKRVERIVEDLNDLGTKRVFLSGGGEPMMHPRFEKILELISSKQMECSFMTNFTTVNQNLIDRIIELGVSEMFVSLWAATSRTYQKTHPNQKRKVFHHIIKMLEYATQRSNQVPNIVIVHTISNANCSEVFKMAKMASKIGVDRVEFVTMDLLEETQHLQMNPEQLASVKKQIRAIENNSNEGFLNQVSFNRFSSTPGTTMLWGFNRFKKRISDYNNPKGFDSSLVDSLPCYVGWTYARIMADGNVIPCCRGSKLPMGNINKTAFKDIWFGTKYDQFRKMALRERKSHPYFRVIDCYSGCDNYTENRIWNNKLKTPVV